MPYRKTSGIYIIKNTINQKVYIGSAINIYSRIACHKRLLRTGKHFNTHLQSAWNVDGEENFVFELLEEVCTETLISREESYIRSYQANNRQYGYNKRDRCNTNFGLKYTAESREKLRVSHLGHKRSAEAQVKISRSQFKPVLKIDSKGNIVERFESIKQAEEITGIFRQSVSACCRHVLRRAGKFYWCFEKDFENFKIPIDERTTRKIRKKRIPSILG